MRRIADLVSCRAGGTQPDLSLCRGLENAPTKLKARLARLGIIQAERVSATRPLVDLAREFRRTLEARGRTMDHVNRTASMVNRVFAGCGFVAWPDNNAGMVERFLKTLRDDGLSAWSRNALCHSFITGLSRAPSLVAQALARHKSSVMTDCYTQVRLYDERATLDLLPDLTVGTGSQQVRATGMDGRNVTPENGARFGSPT
jgi:hypothetical protein